MIKEYYNDKQDEYKITYFKLNDDEISNCIEIVYKDMLKEIIGFYEWLFNPRYKVLEVFGIINDNMIGNDIHDLAINLIRNEDGRKSPAEIIAYLENQIEEQKEN